MYNGAGAKLHTARRVLHQFNLNNTSGKTCTWNVNQCGSLAVEQEHKHVAEWIRFVQRIDIMHDSAADSDEEITPDTLPFTLSLQQRHDLCHERQAFLRL